MDPLREEELRKISEFFGKRCQEEVDKAKKEAYAQGFKDGVEKGRNDMAASSELMKSYREGMKEGYEIGRSYQKEHKRMVKGFIKEIKGAEEEEDEEGGGTVATEAQGEEKEGNMDDDDEDLGSAYA